MKLKIEFEEEDLDNIRKFTDKKIEEFIEDRINEQITKRLDNKKTKSTIGRIFNKVLTKRINEIEFGIKKSEE